MRFMRALILFVAVSVPAVAQQAPQVGDRYELVRSYSTEGRIGETGSSNSHGSDTIEERVIAVEPDSVELVYDLPTGTDAAERARTWQFPARVRRGADGALTLLNAAELEQRLAAWLAAAKWDRTICGKLIFTWNAFRIECDPQSVLAEVRSFDVSCAVAVAGARYIDPDAVAPAILVAEADGHSYVATLQPDPEKVRRARAETDVAVAELMQKPTTIASALAAHASERVVGTVRVTLLIGAEGTVERRTRVTMLEITADNGIIERSTDTRTLERRRLTPVSIGPAA
jgi:hypothetical protein